MIKKLLIVFSVLMVQGLRGPEPARAQGTSAMLAQQNPQSSLSRYYDPKTGLSADEAVAYALAHNGDLAAVRHEIEAAF